MKPRLIARWLATLTGAAALLITGAALAADVHVMISAGFFQAYSVLAPDFERASGHRLVTTRGPCWAILRKRFPPASSGANLSML